MALRGETVSTLISFINNSKLPVDVVYCESAVEPFAKLSGKLCQALVDNQIPFTTVTDTIFDIPDSQLGEFFPQSNALSSSDASDAFIYDAVQDRYIPGPENAPVMTPNFTFALPTSIPPHTAMVDLGALYASLKPEEGGKVDGGSSESSALALVSEYIDIGSDRAV